jgi:excisionase family DNA binding protein
LAVDELGRLLTAAEVAQRLGYTERYVWRLGREGTIRRVKVDGRKYVRFCEADVERFVREGRRLSSVRRPRPAALPATPPRF